jgi:hypothetical protein
MKTIFICLMTLTFAACGGNRDLQKEEMGTFDSDPENMPEQRTLYSPVPIVLLQVVADESGYSVIPFRALGAPSSPINREGRCRDNSHECRWTTDRGYSGGQSASRSNCGVA